MCSHPLHSPNHATFKVAIKGIRFKSNEDIKVVTTAQLKDSRKATFRTVFESDKSNDASAFEVCGINFHLL